MGQNDKGGGALGEKGSGIPPVSPKTVTPSEADRAYRDATALSEDSHPNALPVGVPVSSQNLAGTPQESITPLIHAVFVELKKELRDIRADMSEKMQDFVASKQKDEECRHAEFQEEITRLREANREKEQSIRELCKDRIDDRNHFECELRLRYLAPLLKIGEELQTLFGQWKEKNEDVDHDVLNIILGIVRDRVNLELRSFGVTTLNSEFCGTVNPQIHEVIGHVETLTATDDGLIAQTISAGLVYQGQYLRPEKVLTFIFRNKK